MARLLKWSGYFLLGIFLYLAFVYWTFPFDQVKGRLSSSVEQAMGSDYSVSIQTMSPSFFTGVVLKGVKVSKQVEGENRMVLNADKVKLRVGLISLLMGNPKASFSIVMGKSSIDGSVGKRDTAYQVSIDLDPLLLSSFDAPSTLWGLQMDGKITGAIEFMLDPSLPSDGTVKLSFEGGEIKKGTKIPVLGELTNAIHFATGKGSKMDVKWGKGMMQLNEWKWTDGDLQLNLGGQVYMGSTASSYRLNVTGTFAVSPALEKEWGSIFMLIGKQKQADGTFPIAITGNMDKPSIKIGDMPLPM